MGFLGPTEQGGVEAGEFGTGPGIGGEVAHFVGVGRKVVEFERGHVTAESLRVHLGEDAELHGKRGAVFHGLVVAVVAPEFPILAFGLDLAPRRSEFIAVDEVTAAVADAALLQAVVRERAVIGNFHEDVVAG
jgi:hypothetical protein